MKKISILFLLIFSLFLSSCNDDSQSSSIESEDGNGQSEKIEALESEIENLQKSIQDINDRVDTDREIGRSSDTQRINSFQILFHLVENLSDVELREGYILDYVNEDNEKYLIIDYTDFVDDDSQPNGFRIDNEYVENEKVLITENLQLYIGEYASNPNFPTKIELDSDEMDLEDMKQPFYRFYSIEDELILVLRVYIP